jgi:hypothetical protein
MWKIFKSEFVPQNQTDNKLTSMDSTMDETHPQKKPSQLRKTS